MLVPLMPARAAFREVFKNPTGGSMIKVIIKPMRRIPNTGYKSTGAIFSRASGRRLNSFPRKRTRYPAINPASRAPRNPDFPPAAIIPPTNPTARAGLSPMLMAINPARIGSMKPKAIPPIPFQGRGCRVMVPKADLASSDRELISMLRPSMRKARAMRIPPPTTKGSIWETPFIS